MDKYEYKALELGSLSHIEAHLNLLGKSGWNLITIISEPKLGSSNYSLIGLSTVKTAILKRKINNEKTGD